MNRLNRGACGPATQSFRPLGDADFKISTPALLTAPHWAAELASGPATSETANLDLRHSEHFTLLTLRIPGADIADGPTLESITESAYRKLLLTLQSRPHPHPLRIWNFVPRILDDGGDGLNRYMRFNAGRHRAYADLLGGPNTFDHSLPAASGVGHAGPDMVIHALASSTPGTPIANPRQCPPHRYSRQYGPLPPCFARATRIQIGSDSPMLFIGGTASIRGEHSLHLADLENQLAETRENLIALLGAATNRAPDPQLLNHLDQLRIYYPNSTDLPQIRAAVEQWFRYPDRIEWRPATLCRGELLVEIEGRASLREGEAGVAPGGRGSWRAGIV